MAQGGAEMPETRISKLSRLPMLPATEPQRAGKELSEVDVEPTKPFFEGSLRSLIVLRTYSGSVLGDHSWQCSGDYMG